MCTIDSEKILKIFKRSSLQIELILALTIQNARAYVISLSAKDRS